MYIYVADADTAHAQALAAGATEEMPAMEMFWGDRMGTVLCPFGYKWSFATHIKDPTPEEMPVMEMFWGDRMGTVVCPFGYKWSFATHVKDPTPDEMEAGTKAMMEQMAGGGD